jgi:polyisoprenoid-binding protein YceI
VVRTTALTGEVRLDGQPSVIKVDLHSLSSDQAFRDRYIRNSMFPTSRIATFTVEDAGPVPDGLLGGDQITRTVDGELNIRDLDVPLSFEVDIRIDGDVLQVLGRTTFTWSDLGLTPPRAGPVVSVEDEVRVEVLLQAQPLREGAG